MRRIGLFVLIVLASVACNLSAQPPSVSPTSTPGLPDPTPPPATLTPGADVAPPTLLPLPGPPMTTVPTTSNLCQAYTTYSGTRPDNKLSLRSDPSVAAIQVFRVPNHAQVLLVPGSQEVETEGYHWLQVIYVDTTQMRYQGWMARDSYAVEGVRNPSIATLRPLGIQVPC